MFGHKGRYIRLQTVSFVLSHCKILTVSLVHKKKADSTLIHDLFTEDAFVQKSSPPATAKASPVQHVLPSAVRLEQFNKLLSFMEPRVGRKPTLHTPLVRKRSWLTLLELVADKPQMQRLVDLFHANAEYPETFADAFTRSSVPLFFSIISHRILYRTVP